MGMPVHIGTSGWQYADWRGRFYPRPLAQTQWLEYYAAQFQTVEVNNAFYRLPEVSTFERWRDRVPDDFIVTVKASRYLTHIRRLNEPEEPVHRLMERAQYLGNKLGPILLQLPPNLRRDVPALERTLAEFPAGVRVAFEPRHSSWFCDAVTEVLTRFGAALCLSDSRGRRGSLQRTAEWGYLRFHQGRATPSPCYGRTALESWARRLADLWDDEADVFVYFNNDHGACAVRDADRFAAMVQRAGLTPSRVPGARMVTLEETGRR